MSHFGVISPDIWIVLIGTLTHFLLLLNFGIYWDSWFILEWVAQKEYRVMKAFYSQVGMPFWYYLHRAMALLPFSGHFYKVFTFFSLLASAVLVDHIARLTGFITGNEALFLAVLVMVFPLQQLTVEIAVSTQYQYTGTLFYFGALLAILDLQGAAWPLWEHGLARGGALLCFFVSFNMSSLLMFYGLFFGLFFEVANGGRFPQLDAVAGFVLHRPDYFLLPFLFWFLKNRFAPQHGHYAAYNRIGHYRLRDLVGGFKNLFRRAIFPVLIDAFGSAMRRLDGLAALIAAGLAAHYFPGDAFPAGTLSRNHALGWMVFGTLGLGLAALPYILVGHGGNFGRRGWPTRNSALVPLPLAGLLIGASELFLRPAMIASGLTVVIVACMIYWQSIYLRYLGIWAKYRSMMEKIRILEEVKRCAVVGIRDRHPDPEFGGVFLTCMLASIWGHQTRWLAILETIPRPTVTDERGISRMVGYARKEIDQAIESLLLPDWIGRIDKEGAQGLVIVEPGRGGTGEEAVGIEYLKCQLWRKEGMAALLEGLTRVEFVPMVRPEELENAATANRVTR